MYILYHDLWDIYNNNISVQDVSWIISALQIGVICFRATDMNEHSSRSHAIFIITIECSTVQDLDIVFIISAISNITNETRQHFNILFDMIPSISLMIVVLWSLIMLGICCL